MWIFGAGGFGRETLDACNAAGSAPVGFLDDALAGSQVAGLRVHAAEDIEPASFVVAIAHPPDRARVHRRLVAGGWTAVTVVDPRATIGPRSTLGPGSIVLASAFVSCDVTLGEASHVNYGVTIGHDVAGGDFVTVLPGANVGGTVTLGDGTLVGSGSQILQGRSIGDGATIGAGAVVTADVVDGSTVVGVPARPL